MKWVAVAALIAGLFAVDQLLANLERTELRSEAKTQFESGMRLLREGRAREARASLERAHTLARSDRAVSLGLVEALIALDQRQDAETRLREILSGDSNDGRANLLLARILEGESQPDEAIAYYHRAIYGGWNGAPDERQRVRLELADYLARMTRRKELLSELLLLEDSAAGDLKLAEETAALFLKAGSGVRAAEVYRTILHASPDDRTALRGLAEANLQAGDYRAAETALLRAIKVQPQDAELVHRLHFANTLATLDPTSRRLSPEVRLERADALLASVRVIAAACSSAPIPDQDLAAKDAEARLALAEKLWEQKGGCAPKTPAAETTSLLMQKLRETQ